MTKENQCSESGDTVSNSGLSRHNHYMSSVHEEHLALLWYAAWVEGLLWEPLGSRQFVDYGVQLFVAEA